MPQNSLDSLSVLMVVPSLVQGKFLQRSIHLHGKISIRQCANINEACSAMSEVLPDLVISSMYFDDGDGLDLVTTMQETPEFENILFMLVSSEERFEVIDPIRQSGVISILPKPFSSEDVQDALDHTLIYLSENAQVKEHKSVEHIQILVVDDSKLARRHVIKLLRKGGVSPENITEAEDGSIACELLKSQAFDFILTDYNMPNMDGEQLLVHIRSTAGIKHIPTIMITSERKEVVLKSIKNNGVTALLDKPFDPLQLMHLLQTCA